MLHKISIIMSSDWDINRPIICIDKRHNGNKIYGYSPDTPSNWIYLCEIDYNIVSSCDCIGTCISYCGTMRIAKDKNSKYPKIIDGGGDYEIYYVEETGKEYNVVWVK